MDVSVISKSKSIALIKLSIIVFNKFHQLLHRVSRHEEFSNGSVKLSVVSRFQMKQMPVQVEMERGGKRSNGGKFYKVQSDQR